jgi:hypothetical protein
MFCEAFLNKKTKQFFALGTYCIFILKKVALFDTCVSIRINSSSEAAWWCKWEPVNCHFYMYSIFTVEYSSALKCVGFYSCICRTETAAKSYESNFEQFSSS